ncbi:type I restriction-modification system subunit M/S [Virgisporangium aurantiacum]|uniref:N-6 DNA methylase n=1 Tax=Virgisporangium aurantiacum TaxID=175570 RepID=UPI001950C927|nr:type I restriction-modification system subunit M/S [Virgisporangium aurantiacum]
MAEGVEVTSADIARLAAVRPSAVTNWRRRHTDFPAPIGGSDKSPTFNLAEVAEWLRRQGRPLEIPLADVLWRMVDSLRDTSLSTGDNVGVVGLFLLHLHGDLTDVPDDRQGFTRALTRAEHAMLLRGDRVVAGLVSLLTPIELTDDQLAVLRMAGQCALIDTPSAVFDHVCQRYFERSAINGFSPTPPELAELMLDLASAGRGTLLDPACGSAEILIAATKRGYRQLLGQETNSALARIAVLRLTFATPSATGPLFDVHEGDSLRDDAYPTGNAHAVVCSPPFGERNWGHEELSLDARWEYGVPPRVESELAWVQHCLAHGGRGSTVVMLMPPAVASRPSGKKVRTALVTRGAIRAVIALPPRLAAQHSVPLQLWILQPPSAAPNPSSNIMFADVSDRSASTSAGESSAWTVVQDLATRAWTAFQKDGSSTGGVTQARVVPAHNVLTDGVDLTPRRYLPAPSRGVSDGDLTALRQQVQALMTQLQGAIPSTGPAIGSTPSSRAVSLHDLANTGAIFIRRTHARDVDDGSATSPVPIVRAEDLVRGTRPKELVPISDDPLQLIQENDVLVPIAAPRLIARVAGEEYSGACLSSSVLLIRANSSLVDPWFLAGYLSSLKGDHQARISTGSPRELLRFDPRRVRLPLPDLTTQQAYGRTFRSLSDFERILRTANERAERLIRDLTDTLAADLSGVMPRGTHDASRSDPMNIGDTGVPALLGSPPR